MAILVGLREWGQLRGPFGGISRRRRPFEELFGGHAVHGTVAAVDVLGQLGAAAIALGADLLPAPLLQARGHELVVHEVLPRASCARRRKLAAASRSPRRS